MNDLKTTSHKVAVCLRNNLEADVYWALLLCAVALLKHVAQSSTEIVDWTDNRSHSSNTNSTVSDAVAGQRHARQVNAAGRSQDHRKYFNSEIATSVYPSCCRRSLRVQTINQILTITVLICWMASRKRQRR